MHDKVQTYIEDIDTAFVDKEALEQPLYYDQSFAEEEHNGINPRSPAMEDGKEEKLRPEDQPEQDGVDEERDDRQRYQAPREQWIEVRMAQEVIDPF
jgi:hypothetical protein